MPKLSEKKVHQHARESIIRHGQKADGTANGNFMRRVLMENSVTQIEEMRAKGVSEDEILRET